MLEFALNSKVRNIVRVLCLGSFVVAGCTEELPINAVYTNDTDWAPTIRLSGNDYQRVDIQVDRAPRVELLRNIVSYVIEVHGGTFSNYTAIDTIDKNHANPMYAYSLPPTYTWETKPLLQYSTDYALRVAVSYRTGEIKHSNEIAFTSAPEHGKVLRRLPLPAGVEVGMMNGLAFYKGNLLYASGGRIFEIDTLTGAAKIIKGDFVYRNNASEFSDFNIAIVRDTIIAFYFQGWGWKPEGYNLVRMPMSTLVIDTVLHVTPVFNPEGLDYVISDGSTLWILWDNGFYERLATLDPRTGLTIDSFAYAPREVPDFWGGAMCTDGKSMYAFGSGHTILRLDIPSFTVQESDAYPIAHASSLAWDGEHLWVIDLEAMTFAKIEPERLLFDERR